jgi:hypothetical protein
LYIIAVGKPNVTKLANFPEVMLDLRFSQWWLWRMLSSECDTMQSGRNLLMFLWIIGKLVPHCTVMHPRR